MARSHARIYTAIWKDDDFLALSPEAQRFFFLVLSQPGVSFCGVLALTIRRWATLAKGSTIKSVTKAVEELQDARFVVVDWDTEELWIRSFVRWDGVLTGGPKVLTRMWGDFDLIASPALRTLFLAAVKSDTPSDTPSDGVSRARPRASRAASNHLPPATYHQPPSIAVVAEATPLSEQTRKPDPLWDALVAELGYQPETPSGRGPWNAALKQIRDAGATRPDVEARCAEYRRRWPDMSLTPPALAKHWAALGVPAPPALPASWPALKRLAEGAP